MNNIIAIALGGAFGAVGRFGTSHWVYETFGRSFPYGTLAVNILGSFVMGLLTVLLVDRFNTTPEVRGFMLIGFLGAFTTFSTFSIETLNLINHGDMVRAGLNMVISVLVCVTACWLGMVLGRQI